MTWHLKTAEIIRRFGNKSKCLWITSFSVFLLEGPIMFPEVLGNNIQIVPALTKCAPFMEQRSGMSGRSRSARRQELLWVKQRLKKKKKKTKAKQSKLTGHPESCTDTNRLQYSGTGPPSLVRLAKGKRHRVHTVEWDADRTIEQTWYIQPGKGPAREMQILGRQVGSELTEKIPLCVLVSKKQTSHIRWPGEHGLSRNSLQITFYANSQQSPTHLVMGWQETKWKDDRSRSGVTFSWRLCCWHLCQGHCEILKVLRWHLRGSPPALGRVYPNHWGQQQIAAMSVQPKRMALRFS